MSAAQPIFNEQTIMPGLPANDVDGENRKSSFFNSFKRAAKGVGTAAWQNRKSIALTMGTGMGLRLGITALLGTTALSPVMVVAAAGIGTAATIGLGKSAYANYQRGAGFKANFSNIVFSKQVGFALAFGSAGAAALPAITEFVMPAVSEAVSAFFGATPAYAIEGPGGPGNGQGDSGPSGPSGHGDSGPSGHGDSGPSGHGDSGPSGHGDSGPSGGGNDAPGAGDNGDSGPQDGTPGGNSDSCGGCNGDRGGPTGTPDTPDTPDTPTHDGGGEDREPREPWCPDGQVVREGHLLNRIFNPTCERIIEQPQMSTPQMSTPHQPVVYQPAPPPPPICDGIPEDATAYEFEIVERVETPATEEAPVAEADAAAQAEADAAAQAEADAAAQAEADAAAQAEADAAAQAEADAAAQAEADAAAQAEADAAAQAEADAAAQAEADAAAQAEADAAAEESNEMVINLNDADPHLVVSGDNMWDIVEERFADILDCESEGYDERVQRITDMIAFVNGYENAEAHIIHPGDELNMLTPEVAEMIINMDEYVFSQCWEGLDYRTIQGGGFIIATEPGEACATDGAEADNVINLRPQQRPMLDTPALQAA